MSLDGRSTEVLARRRSFRRATACSRNGDTYGKRRGGRPPYPHTPIH